MKMEETRINWQQYFMAQAELVSLRSTCTRLMVGAVIVRDNRIIASGYNGSISDGDHCMDKGCYVVDGHCIRTIHAEVNALLRCARFGVSTEDTTIYVTYFRCIHCLKHLIQAGVEEEYYDSDYRTDRLDIEHFKEANVKVNIHVLALAILSSFISLETDTFYIILLYLLWILYLAFKNILQIKMIFYSLLFLVASYLLLPTEHVNYSKEKLPEESIILKGKIDSQVYLKDSSLSFILKSATNHVNIRYFYEQD